MNILQEALELGKKGFYLFPVQGKTPLANMKWRQRSAGGEATIRYLFVPYLGKPFNIGLDCGRSNLVVIDCDVEYTDTTGKVWHPGHDGIADWERFKQEYDIDDSGALKQRTGGGGLQLVFTDTTNGLIGNHNPFKKRGYEIDVRGNGGYVVVAPSIHPLTQQSYKWLNPAQFPSPLPANLARFLLKPPPIPIIATPAPAPTDQPTTGRDYTAYVATAVKAETQQLAQTQAGGRNAALNLAAVRLGEIAAASWSGYSPSAAETDLFNAAIQNGLVADDGERAARKTIASGLKKGLAQPREAPASIEERGAYSTPSAQENTPSAQDGTGTTAIVDIHKAPIEQLETDTMRASLNRNEMGDAQLIEKLYSHHLRYDHTMKSWFYWDGTHWQHDRMNKVRALLNREVGAQYLNASVNARRGGSSELSTHLIKRASALGTKARLNNIMDLASSLPALAIRGNEWDANPMLLGTKNGIIDLTTGEFRISQPGDYVQKYAPTKWKGLDARAPRFELFIREIFNHDQELVDFAQRLFGYGITGSNAEQVFVILHGAGRNGKDTLLEALGDTLGSDLADRVPSGVLMTSGNRSNAASPELMELQGQRIAWVTETSRHAQLNTNQVKNITGRSTLKARPLYGDYITFSVQYLLLLLTNNKPVIPADDFAIWKRVLLIPFDLSFVEKPTAQNERLRDSQLLDKLSSERSGILAWLIKGCLAWQKDGLQPPDRVRQATQAYQQEENTLQQFLEECCYVNRKDSTIYTEAVALRSAYNEWAKLNDERIMKVREFSAEAAKVFKDGLHPDNRNRRKIYIGVGLLSATHQ